MIHDMDDKIKIIREKDKKILAEFAPEFEILFDKYFLYDDFHFEASMLAGYPDLHAGFVMTLVGKFRFRDETNS